MIYELYNAISILNIILVILLLALFIDNYRRVRAPFTLGLILFALVFLVNTLLSCPVIQACTGGAICACPNIYYHAGASLFEFFALILLVYLVRK